MRNTLLLGMLVIIIGLSTIYALSNSNDNYSLSSAIQPTPENYMKVTKGGLWGLIQEWRVSQGLKEYQELPQLCSIAEKRVLEVQKDFEHTKFHNDYINYPSRLTENLSIDFNNEDTLQGWLNSPPHRKALERPDRYSCLAVMGQYQVQIFSNCENGCPTTK